MFRLPFLLLFQAAENPPAAGSPPEDLTDVNAVMDWLVGFVQTYGPKVVGALLTLVIGLIVVGWITRGVRTALVRAKVDATLAGFLANIARTGLLVMVFISAVGKLGVETTSFVAVLGACGLAVGLALQSSLGNLAAGVMIMFFKPFQVGDFVEAGGTVGVVEEILVFSTRLKTGDNKRIIVPNSQITSGTIVNYSANDTRRIDLVFGIGYGDDLKQAKSILERLCAEDPRILQEPAPVIAVGELADSSVNLLCRPWVKTGDYWAVYWDLLEKAKEAFDAAGVSIPFPQTDVHLHKVGDAA
ncbi:MAG: mechanosensitive ion channel family protein [Planctomycetota bacterium]|nr:MAG: mechanosensitive ion channel family protein [Planctomycetota bacterium]